MSNDRYWSTAQEHAYSWERVAAAYWQRYPNPQSGHVFSEDFVETSCQGGKVVCTKRVIIKTNKLPSWGSHFFSAKRVALVEESVCDRSQRTLVTYTRNIGLRFFMGVTEKVTFSPHPSDPAGKTRVSKEVWIDSDVFGFQAAIRKFGVDRFKRNCVRASEGFDWVLKNRMKYDDMDEESRQEAKAMATAKSLSSAVQDVLSRTRQADSV